MWHTIGKLADFPLGEARELVIGCHVIAVFHTSEGIFALDGMCAHQGGPLAKGAVSNCVLTCPWHGWQYDLKTGQHLTAKSVRVQSFPVEVNGDEIRLLVEA